MDDSCFVMAVIALTTHEASSREWRDVSQDELFSCSRASAIRKSAPQVKRTMSNDVMRGHDEEQVK